MRCECEKEKRGRINKRGLMGEAICGKKIVRGVRPPSQSSVLLRIPGLRLLVQAVALVEVIAILLFAGDEILV
jgi:hypothetical protein